MVRKAAAVVIPFTHHWSSTVCRLWAAIFSAAALLLTVSACTGSGGAGGSANQACIRASVLDDADILRKYADGPGRDIVDIEFDAKIAVVNIDCDIQDDGRRLEAIVTIAIAVTRGAAADTANIKYFVAIVGPGEQILTKQGFDSAISFPVGRSKLTAVEEIAQTLPLDENLQAGDYQILIGFQLTPSQLEANRQRRR